MSKIISILEEKEKLDAMKHILEMIYIERTRMDFTMEERKSLEENLLDSLIYYYGEYRKE